MLAHAAKRAPQRADVKLEDIAGIGLYENEVTENEQHIARSAIAATLAACTQAGDARKADAYAKCFAHDGVLELDEKIEGRESIRRWMAAPSVIPAPSGGASGYVSHHLTTCRIELVGGREAAARTYWLVISAAGLDHSGYYDDRLCKTDEGWVIAYRRPRTLWVAPNSVLHARKDAPDS